MTRFISDPDRLAWSTALPLRPPATALTALARPKLLAQLDRVPAGGSCIVTAPAGYGKTTLLSQYLDASDWCAWLTLGADDAEPAILLRHLLHAVTPPAELAALPELSFEGDISLHVSALIDRMAGWGSDRVVLCIDEYDVAASAKVDEVLLTLMQRLPPQFRMLLASRQPASMSVAKLKAEGRVIEITARDLRFDPAEAQALLGDMIAPDAIARLYEQTEGWPLALQLVRIWLETHPAAAPEIASFQGPLGEIARYLAEQVLARQPEPAVALLRDCSILQQIEPDLVDWIRERSDSHAVLAGLQSLDPFLTKVTGTAKTYRLHQLVAQFLREDLHAVRSAEEIAALHRRAAEWFKRAGYVSDALRHAVLAGDPDLAVAIFESIGGLSAIVQIGSPGLRAMCAALPAGLFEQAPKLRLARSLALLTGGYPEEARRLFTATVREIGDLARLPTDYSTDVRIAEIFFAIYCDTEVPAESLANIETLLREIGDEQPAFRFFGLMFLAAYYQQYGDLITAESSLAEFRRHALESGSPAALSSADAFKGAIDFARGDLAAAKASLRSAIDRAAAAPALSSNIHHIGARVFLAEVLYEENDLGGAHQHVSAILPQLELAQGWFDAYAAAFELAARSAFATGSIDESIVACERLRALAQRRGYGRLLRLSNAFEADICAQAGLYDEVVGKVHGFAEIVAAGTLGSRDIRTWREYDATASALIRWAMGNGRHALALSLIGELFELGRRQHRRRPMIKALLLRAITLQLRGELEPALGALRDAIDIASPVGMCRTLLDEGEPLRRLAWRGLKANAAGTLTDEHRAYLSGLYAEDRAGAPIFSQREYDVLSELAQGHSNKLIARRLNMSENTVKTHLKKAYSKLGVTDRHEAILRAQSLGMLA